MKNTASEWSHCSAEESTTGCRGRKDYSKRAALVQTAGVCHDNCIYWGAFVGTKWQRYCGRMITVGCRRVNLSVTWKSFSQTRLKSSKLWDRWLYVLFLKHDFWFKPLRALKSRQGASLKIIFVLKEENSSSIWGLQLKHSWRDDLFIIHSNNPQRKGA